LVALFKVEGDKRTKVGKFGVLAENGFFTLGSDHKPLPAGKYLIYIKNVGEKSGEITNVSMNFYFLKEKG
jgi:hypothetical protein